jgi:hypothetical protein
MALGTEGPADPTVRLASRKRYYRYSSIEPTLPLSVTPTRWQLGRISPTVGPMSVPRSDKELRGRHVFATFAIKDKLNCWLVKGVCPEG